MKKLVIKNYETLCAIRGLIKARTERCDSIEHMINARHDADGELTRGDINDLKEELAEHRQWLKAAEAGVSEYLRPAQIGAAA